MEHMRQDKNRARLNCKLNWARWWVQGFSVLLDICLLHAPWRNLMVTAPWVNEQPCTWYHWPLRGSSWQSSNCPSMAWKCTAWDKWVKPYKGSSATPELSNDCWAFPYAISFLPCLSSKNNREDGVREEGRERFYFQTIILCSSFMIALVFAGKTS